MFTITIVWVGHWWGLEVAGLWEKVYREMFGVRNDKQPFIIMDSKIFIFTAPFVPKQRTILEQVKQLIKLLLLYRFPPMPH